MEPVRQSLSIGEAIEASKKTPGKTQALGNISIICFNLYGPVVEYIRNTDVGSDFQNTELTSKFRETKLNTIFYSGQHGMETARNILVDAPSGTLTTICIALWLSGNTHVRNAINMYYETLGKLYHIAEEYIHNHLTTESLYQAYAIKRPQDVADYVNTTYFDGKLNITPVDIRDIIKVILVINDARIMTTVDILTSADKKGKSVASSGSLITFIQNLERTSIQNNVLLIDQIRVFRHILSVISAPSTRGKGKTATKKDSATASSPAEPSPEISFSLDLTDDSSNKIHKL